jgi:hypothetical protein
MVEPVERPSRWRLTYCFEIVGLGPSGRGANRVWNFPVNPQRTFVHTRPAVELVYTNGGVSVHESGFVPRDVRISGSMGLERKAGWALESDSPHNPSVGIVYRDGNALYDEMNRLFEWYWKTKRSQDTASKWMLVFHDFRRDRHWVIVPTDIESDRESRGHRLHYPYELAFTAIADYDALEPGGIAGVLAAIRKGTELVQNVIGTVSGWIADAAALVREVDAAISGLVNVVANGMNELRNALTDLIQAGRNFLDLPRRTARNYLAALDNLTGELQRGLGLAQEAGQQGEAWSPTNSSASRLAAFYSSTRQVEAAVNSLLADRDLWAPDMQDARERRDRLALGEGALTSAETAGDGTLSLAARSMPGSGQRAALRRLQRTRARPAYTGVREYVVRDDDTPRRIAVRELGDGSLWADVADLNNLRPPYFSRAALPGTVKPGRSILLPTLERPVGAVGGESVEDIEIDALGVNWELTDEGEFRPNAARNGCELVRGMPCYVQALEKVRFRTRLGENPVFPDVGILAPVGAKNGAGMVQAVALSVRRACLTDPRTQSVVDLAINDEGDGIEVEVSVQPRAMSGPVLVTKRGGVAA